MDPISLGVLPSSIVNNIVHDIPAQAVFPGKVSLSFTQPVSLPNGVSDSIRRSGLWLVFAFCALTTTFCSAFFRHVSQVVGICSEKQMSRVATRRIIAAVTNMQPVRYWPVGQLVTNAMGQALATIHMKHAISFDERAALPFPTIIRVTNSNVCPKSFDRKWFSSSSSRVADDKSNRLTFDPSKLRASLSGNFCLLSATAVAISVGDFLCSFVRGKIGHDIRSLLAVSRPGTVSAVARYFHWVCRCNYSTNTPVRQMEETSWIP